MANRNQDNQPGRGRGDSPRGWDENYDEGDSSARAGRYDEGQQRERYGRDTNEQSGSTGRYAGYGQWGQGNYSGSGRGANTGQNRYGQSGYSGRDPGYQGGSVYGSGRNEDDFGSRAQGRDRPSEYGYGYGGYGSGRSWNEPYGEGQQYDSQRGWDRGGSQYGGSQHGVTQPGGYRAGSGQSSGYGGPLYSGAQPGSEFGYGGAQGGGSQYGNYGAESVFGGSSQFGASPYGYGATGQGQHRGKGPKGYQRSDERTKELLCERLREDPHIDPSEVTITVQGGKITLEGTVDSRQTKNAIEEVAEQFGTQDVQNNLRIQKTQGMQSTTESGRQSKGSGDDNASTKIKQH